MTGHDPPENHNQGTSETTEKVGRLNLMPPQPIPDHVKRNIRRAGQSPLATLPAGTEIKKFRIEETLGVGGMGEVYRAFDKDLSSKSTPVYRALKRCRSTRIDEFKREARILTDLRHDNVVAAHDCFEHQGDFFIVMEYVEGVSLRQIIDAQGIELKTGTIFEIIRQVSEGLRYVHSEGIVHADLKPENILINLRGRVKVADFGLSSWRQNHNEYVSQSGEIKGTPAFMAPEQHRGRLGLDARTDMFSVGCVLHNLLTGSPPRRNLTGDLETLEVAADVAHLVDADRIEDLIGKLLREAPEGRMQSASELLTEIDGMADGTGLSDLVVDSLAVWHADSETTTPITECKRLIEEPDSSSTDRRSWMMNVAIGATTTIGAVGGVWWMNRPIHKPLAADTILSLPGLSGNWHCDEIPWLTPVVRRCMCEHRLFHRHDDEFLSLALHSSLDLYPRLNAFADEAAKGSTYSLEHFGALQDSSLVEGPFRQLLAVTTAQPAPVYFHTLANWAHIAAQQRQPLNAVGEGSSVRLFAIANEYYQTAAEGYADSWVDTGLKKLCFYDWGRMWINLAGKLADDSIKVSEIDTPSAGYHEAALHLRSAINLDRDRFMAPLFEAEGRIQLAVAYRELREFAAVEKHMNDAEGLFGDGEHRISRNSTFHGHFLERKSWCRMEVVLGDTPLFDMNNVDSANAAAQDFETAADLREEMRDQNGWTSWSERHYWNDLHGFAMAIRYNNAGQLSYGTSFEEYESIRRELKTLLKKKWTNDRWERYLNSCSRQIDAALLGPTRSTTKKSIYALFREAVELSDRDSAIVTDKFAARDIYDRLVIAGRLVPTDDEWAQGLVNEYAATVVSKRIESQPNVSFTSGELLSHVADVCVVLGEEAPAGEERIAKIQQVLSRVTIDFETLRLRRDDTEWLLLLWKVLVMPDAATIPSSAKWAKLLRGRLPEKLFTSYNV